MKSEEEIREKLKGVLDSGEFPVFLLPAVLSFVWVLELDKDEAVALVIAAVEKGECSMQSGIEELSHHLKELLAL